METTMIRNTELLRVSVEDLDNNFDRIIHKDIEEVITDTSLPENMFGPNIIREKTFNKELSSLVNQIFENESHPGKPLQDSSDIDFTKKNKILIDLEKEIYRLKHIEELSRNSSSYNPFELNVNTFDDIDDIEDYILRGINQSGLNSYSVMKYSLNDSAYAADIGNFDDFKKTNVIFSVKDPVFKALSESPDGIFLSAEQIKSDPFLSKKFINPESLTDAVESYYMIKLTGLNTPLTEKIELMSTDRISGFLSPMLIAAVESDKSISVKDLSGSLKRNLAIPMAIYRLKNRINFEIADYSFEETLLIIDLFIKSDPETEIKCLILSLSDSSARENIFILKYLLTRIRSTMEKDSLIFRITLDRVIIATTDQNIDKIYRLISHMNVYGEDLVDIQIIDRDQSRDVNLQMKYFS